MYAVISIIHIISHDWKKERSVVATPEFISLELSDVLMINNLYALESLDFGLDYIILIPIWITHWLQIPIPKITSN